MKKLSSNISANAVYAASVIRSSDSGSLHVFVTDDKKSAYYLSSDLDNFFMEENLYFFPSTSEKSEYKRATALLQRTSALSAIATHPVSEKRDSEPSDNIGFEISDDILRRESSKATLIVTYCEAIEEKCVRSSRIRESVISLKVGQSMSHNLIREKLQEKGFRKVDFVTEPGEFALRGAIVDIFSYAGERPFRIDFFGNEIEAIRSFNTDSQLSVASYDNVDIYPNLDDRVSEEKEDVVDFKEILPEDTVWWNFTTSLSFRDIKRREYVDNIVPQPVFSKNFDLLRNDISKKRSEGYAVTILSPNDAQTRRLREILQGVSVRFLPLLLHEGYIDKKSGNCYYTDHQIFERYHKLNLHRQVVRSEQMTINELNALQIGDYIVHIDHGVGQYGGLVKTNSGGKVQEAVKLIYRDGDVIFVSIHSLHRISRYKSRDGETPRIYKLGSKAWDNLKNNARRKVKDIAKDLIKLYAERQQARGFAFSPDSYLQQELESSFIYEDTPDQMRATEAVKADMESLHPMDRLICGDVGFGKTEIAIRAAFKAVCDSKQVVVLVPTTILALQHYQTFSERLKDFPCTVDYISRLRSSKEIREVIAKVESGRTDILIGTHRVLGNSVRFKDLGLLIIDEEQKFGVTSKEKIRQMKSSIDTLTLTATPIPRTLQFSLLGARDMSVISTPPPNRLPVATELIDFDEEVIADILNRELERGGQVYFVHNRVDDIGRVAETLHRICPRADICVAHGQMEPAELEKKMMDFIGGDYDILLSTTIVENGIDIPNANTMIVDRAHRFGLGDLHQLRGRVGRSNVKAYCYLIVPSEDRLNDDARRRIHALEAFSDLGSGFNIAMQDLDIRGAGNLLGAEQSGFMEEMGFETYMRIIKEAVSEMELPGDCPVPVLAQETLDVQVETDLEVLIPDQYVNVPSEKIRLYRELDNISNEDDLKMFIGRVADRFGSPLPVQLIELTEIVRLRMKASLAGIERIVLKNDTMNAYFPSDRNSAFYRSDKFAEILQKIASGRGQLLETGGRLHLRFRNVKSVSQAIKTISFLV